MTSANENLPAGMGGLKYPVSQVSLVVNDLHRTMERYYEAFGWTGWRVFDHVEPMHHGTQLRGKPDRQGGRASRTEHPALSPVHRCSWLCMATVYPALS